MSSSSPPSSFIITFYPYEHQSLTCLFNDNLFYLQSELEVISSHMNGTSHGTGMKEDHDDYDEDYFDDVDYEKDVDSDVYPI